MVLQWKQDAVRTIKKIFGDGIVITHRSGNGGVYGWEDGRRKGKTRSTVVRNYLNKHYGRGNDSQINETKADLNGSAFSIGDTQFSLSTDDIRTWDEVLELNDESEGQFVWGDFSRTDAEQALKDGTITIYSSYPIKNGVFVSTSYIQAQEYAGGENGKVYSKTVPLANVAWINGDEGQYAEVNTAYSLSKQGEDIAPVGTPLQDLYLAPIREDIAENATPTATEDIAPMPTDADVPFPDEIVPMTEEEANAIQDEKAKADADAEGQPKTRKQLHHKIIDNVKSVFNGKGFDFDEVLKKAKNLSTFSTVDNTPQRVMEKALGYKEGQALADLTVNKVAQNETEGIKWLNSFTDRKNGLLTQISKQYNIKPASKESAAAQMYAEGFYVDENNDIVAYGDAELAQDFPDTKVRNNIKGLAKDPRIRQIYDETLTAINESRTRNAYFSWRTYV